MLKIRDAVKNHVWYNIGNGKSISVFYDKCCSYGPLSEMISRRSIYDERINDDIVIADIVNNGKWTWPEEWKSIYPILNSIHDPIIKDSEDRVLWITKNADKVQFSTKQAWEDLRDEWPKVWNGIMDVTHNLGRQSSLNDIVNLIANGKAVNSITTRFGILYFIVRSGLVYCSGGLSGKYIVLAVCQIVHCSSGLSFLTEAHSVSYALSQYVLCFTHSVSYALSQYVLYAFSYAP
ncbi:hypothetical protein Tco_1088798, partial [Tanacetum coccineum]